MSQYSSRLASALLNFGLILGSAYLDLTFFCFGSLQLELGEVMALSEGLDLPENLFQAKSTAKSSFSNSCALSLKSVKRSSPVRIDSCNSLMFFFNGDDGFLQLPDLSAQFANFAFERKMPTGGFPSACDQSTSDHFSLRRKK